MCQEKDINEIEEIRLELNECREDERNAQNQIIQVVCTAGTILGVVFGATTFCTAEKQEQLRHILFYLNALVLVIALSYIAAVGISNVLRFHYLRDLEDKLSVLVSKEMIHWMSFSSPITTRNPLHLKNIYSIFHYLSYAISTCAAIGFCLVIAYFQYESLNTHTQIDKLVIMALQIIIAIEFLSFTVMSIKAKKMFDYSKRISEINRNKRLKERGKVVKFREKIYVILYYIYPKKKDFQKTFLILIGFLTGVFLLRNECAFSDLWKDFIVSYVVIEFLVYQARYLWNDVRGIDDDKKDRKKEKTGRLPVSYLGEKKAILIAFFVIAIRLILAWLIIECYNSDIKVVLKIGMCTLVIVSILYEISRTKKWNYSIFLLVSLGYPIRFFIGFLVAFSNLGAIKIDAINNTRFIIILFLLFFAYMCLGEFSSTIPWAHEALILKKSGQAITKSSYFYILSFMNDRYCESVRRNNNKPLIEKGKLSDIWNLSFLLGIILLSLISLLMIKSKGILWILEICIVFSSIKMCLAKYKKIVLFTVLTILLIVIKLIIYGSFGTFIYIGVNQLIFVLLYFGLRYFFNPSYDFFNELKKIFILMKKYIKKLSYNVMCVLVGRKIWERINETER